MMYLRATILILSICFYNMVLGQLSVSSLFSDNMVLQRNDTVKIWGTSDKSVKLEASWLSSSIESKPDKQGKWRIWLPTTDAGGPYTITIQAKETMTIENVMLGEVWLCTGQSNMEMPLRGFMGQPVKGSNSEIINSTNSLIRHINIPRKSTTIPNPTFEAKWEEASPATSGEFSATAYFFAKQIHEITGLPIGIINVTYGGSNAEAWMNKASLEAFAGIEVPLNDEAIGEKNRTPTVLYNGMLNPVIGYTVAGAIWYQGESNVGKPIEYETLFPAMVKLWRDQWGQGEFPFYYTQIAPFNYNSFYPESNPWFANSAYLRDAQRKAQYTIPKSGMISLLDAGEMFNIHPMDKKTPGERLAWIALNKSYGYEGFGFETPDFDALNIQDTLVTVTFKQLPNGLSSLGKEVTAFQIAGADKIFYPAQCNVRRKTVQIWSSKVKAPVAVRYAFTNEGPAQLFSTEGIPISSFRTDDWNPEAVNTKK
ncbi:MAG: sialate O-acetylesterase [Cyclobacteriaceae bacterium]